MNTKQQWLHHEWFNSPTLSTHKCNTTLPLINLLCAFKHISSWLVRGHLAKDRGERTSTPGTRLIRLPPKVASTYLYTHNITKTSYKTYWNNVRTLHVFLCDTSQTSWTLFIQKTFPLLQSQQINSSYYLCVTTTVRSRVIRKIFL